MDKKYIAVIGAGVSGLVAAYRLAQAGHEVVLFEREKLLGGLVSGFKIQGQNLEKAYHHLFTTDRYILNLARELGLESELLYLKNSTAFYYHGSVFAFGSPWDLVTFKPLNFVDKLRFAFVTLYLKNIRKWRRLIRIPAFEWLEKWYGKKIYSIIWKPLLQGKFHEFYQDISMAWLWARIHTRANSSRMGQEMLVYFKHGFQCLIDALERSLQEQGVSIVREAELERIVFDQKPRIQLSNGQTSTFDDIVCTTPSYVFAKLIQGNNEVSNQYLQKLHSISYLGAVLLVFSSRQSLSKYYWHNMNDPNSPFVAFIQHTNLVSPSYFHGEHVYYLGTYVPHEHRLFTINESEVEQEFLAYLKKIFPVFQGTQITEKHLFRLKNAQHVVTTDYEDKIPDYRTPLPHVFLANFSQVFPEDRGTNFAVREGEKIAQLVIAA